VVQTSSTITTRAPFFAEAFQCAVRAMLFLGFAHEKAVEVPLVTATATTIGSAPMVRPPRAGGFPNLLANLVQKNLPY